MVSEASGRGEPVADVAAGFSLRTWKTHPEGCGYSQSRSNLPILATFARIAVPSAGIQDVNS
jgi:hypothetical protein